MRFIALAAALALTAAGPALSQTRECQGFQAGQGWTTSVTVFTRADGAVFDSVEATIFTVELPTKPGGPFEVDSAMDRLNLPGKAVLILQTGRRPGGLPALGHFTLAAPSYFNPGKALIAGLEGKKPEAPPHFLVWKTGGRTFDTQGVQIRTPTSMAASQASSVAAGLGYTDAEAPTAGGPAEAERARDLIDTFLSQGGDLEIQVQDDGRRQLAARFSISRQTALAAKAGTAKARADAERAAAAKTCKAA